MTIYNCDLGVVQAALAVGAVKDGHGTATHREWSHQPMPNPNHWDRTDRGCGIRGMEVDVHDVKLLSPDESHFRQRHESALSGEFNSGFGENSERTSYDMNTEHMLRREQAGTRAVAQVDARAKAEPCLERDRPPTYGRGCYHDSRRSLELMPTLPETDGPQEQARLPLRSRAPFSTTRSSIPLPPPKVATAVAERFNMATAENFIDSDPRVVLHVGERERGQTGHRLVDHPPAARKATRTTSGEWKHRPAENPLPGSSLHDNGVSVKRPSPDADHCPAREADEIRNRDANRVAPSIAADGGEGLVVADHTAVAIQRGELHEPPSSQFSLAQPERGGDQAVARSSGRIRTTLPACSALSTSRHSVTLSCGPTEVGKSSVDLSEHDPGGLSTRQRMAVARNTPAADFQPVETAQFSSSRKDSGMLSPAPCHGGSPAAIPSSVAPPEASKGLNRPTSRRAHVVDLGLPSPQHPPGLQAHAADEHVDLCVCAHDCRSYAGVPVACTSRHSCLTRKATVGDGDIIGTLGMSPACTQQPVSARDPLEQTAAPSVIGTVVTPVSKPDLGTFSSRHAPLERAQKEGFWGPGWSGANGFDNRDGREKQPPGLGGSRNVAQREDCVEESKTGTGWMSHADHFTMDIAAAGCTPALYEELLEPRVVTVYSR